METKPEENHKRRVGGEQHVDAGTIPNHGAHRPDILNQNPNQNLIQGPGIIFNYNPVMNNVAYEDTSKESVRYTGSIWKDRLLTVFCDILHMKIFIILESQHVPQAVYGAQIEKGCMEGTRVQILRDIDAWIKDPKAPQIFWLAGMAGTGKSAIAWTVCYRSSNDHEILLGGSFFCSRSTGMSSQRDVRCVIPTLAILLARRSPAFKQALAAELAADQDVLHQQVEMQVEKLLYKPLLALKDSTVPVLFVIDALDECGGQLKADGTLDDAETHRVVSDMLEALVAFSRSTIKVPVKFLVTSRPETHIRDTHVSDVAFSKVLRLHTVDKQQVDADIRLYISNRLFGTAARRTLFTDNDVNRLVKFCDGLFIVAATALHHALGGGTDLAVARLRSLLKTTRERLPVGVAAPLDRMYGVILEDAAKADTTDADQLPNLLRVFAALLAARQTLSVAALADLMSQTKEHLRGAICHVHAVINVPEDHDDASLRPLHASFGDYLLGRAPSRFRISQSLGHDVLAHGCFQVMEKRLHFNVSQSRSSFEQNPSTKPTSITLSLEYACLQWTYHVSGLIASQSKSGTTLSSALRSRFRSLLNRGPSLKSELDGKVAGIFRPQLLFWLEVMSCLGQVQRAAAMLIFAAATVKSKDLKLFLRDASSFVASSREAIERSAAHVYISALPFASKDSLIYQNFFPLCTGLVDVELFGIPHHAGRLAMALTGHVGAVLSIAYCLDGSFLASGSADGTVRIWDMRTGEETMTPLCSGDGAVLSVAFSPNTENVASGTEVGIVCIWPLLAALSTPKRLRGHSDVVTSVQFAPDGFLLASASSDKTVRLWSATTDQQVTVLRGHTANITTISFAPDSLFLASGSEDRTIQVWNVATGKPIYSPPHHHEQPIFSVCFLPDGQSIAAGCGNSIIICKLQTGRKSKTVYAGTSAIRSVQSSSDGQYLISAHENSVCISSMPRLTSRSSSVVLDGHTKSVRAAAFAPDGDYAASASDDCTIRIWSVIGRSEPLLLTGNNSEVDAAAVSALIMSDARVLQGHTSWVYSVAISNDCSFMASGSGDKSVRVWDVRTGNLKFPPLLGHTGEVYSVDISSDGCIIASASEDCTVRLWDAQTGVPIGSPMEGHTMLVRSVAFASDARWLASASFDKAIRIWDVVAHQSSAVGPLMRSNLLRTVVFSPDDRLVAAGDDGGLVHVWDRVTGRSTHEPIRSKASPIYSLGFSPDGKYIASGGQPGGTPGSSPVIQIWAITTGQCALTLTGYVTIVTSLKYSTDGRFIVSGSWDNSVQLWDVATGAPIAKLSGHTAGVCAAAYAANGRFVVSGSTDKTIRIWNLTDAAREYMSSAENPSAALDSADLENGWLTGSSGELLLWIPADYRKYFPMHRIEQRGIKLAVDSSGWYCGESWTACWRDATSDSALPAI